MIDKSDQRHSSFITEPNSLCVKVVGCLEGMLRGVPVRRKPGVPSQLGHVLFPMIDKSHCDQLHSSFITELNSLCVKVAGCLEGMLRGVLVRGSLETSVRLTGRRDITEISFNDIKQNSDCWGSLFVDHKAETLSISID